MSSPDAAETLTEIQIQDPLGYNKVFGPVSASMVLNSKAGLTPQEIRAPYYKVWGQQLFKEVGHETKLFAKQPGVGLLSFNLSC